MPPSAATDRHRRSAVAAAVLALALVVGTVPAPGSDVGTVLYLLPVVVAVLVTVVAVASMGADWRTPWTWLAVSLVTIATGEVLFAVLALQGNESWPTVADAAYLLSYLPMTVGLLQLNRQRSSGSHRASLLDAGIVSVSAATVFGVFVLLPAVADGSQPLLARVVGSAYPLADVVLFFVIVRTLTTGGARSASSWLLTGGLAATIAADLAWNLVQLTTGGADSPRWTNLLWLAQYACTAMAATLARRPAQATAVQDRIGLTVRRLLLLALAAALPSAVLVSYSLSGRTVPVAWLAAGSIAVIALVVARMWDLLQQVRAQAARLASLARTDPLTGLPNRRTWDHELDRARARAATTGEELFVALLDLDHFKEYNDTRGHQAGDHLLRTVAARWAQALPEAASIARWGGEEFSVLLTGLDRDEAVVVLDGLRACVPDARTCSVGVARWDRTEDPSTTLARADEALYLAKSSGRDRLCGPAPTTAPAR